jgi:integrase
MRRGDCCQLKWKDVDPAAGFLSVETAKTGETVDIPIFPMLAEELRRARVAAGESPYCFPGAALMYESNPDGITWRVKQVLARALEPAEALSEDPTPKDQALAKGRAFLDRLAPSKRTEKQRAVFEAYVGGGSLEDVIAKTGCSRGTVSNYLNEIERGTGCAILRGKRRAAKTDGLQAERKQGARRASIHDFHSFRVTWITLALAAGVPLELVQRVTGHRTVAVVLKHYFRPGREDFRQALVAAMPKMLGDGGRKAPKEEMREILERMTAGTITTDRKRLLELVATL